MIGRLRSVASVALVTAAIGGSTVVAAPHAAAGPIWRSHYVGPYASETSCDDARQGYINPPDDYAGWCLYYTADPRGQGVDRGPGWYFEHVFNINPN